MTRGLEMRWLLVATCAAAMSVSGCGLFVQAGSRGASPVNSAAQSGTPGPTGSPAEAPAAHGPMHPSGEGDDALGHHGSELSGKVSVAAMRPPSTQEGLALNPASPFDEGIHDHGAEDGWDEAPEDELSDTVELDLTPRSHPHDNLSPSDLEQLLLKSPEKLGSLSVGRPNGGVLINGIRLPDSDLYRLVAPWTAFATQETIDYLTQALRKVREDHPDAPPLFVGDVSAKSGGYLTPHLSHQSGRDVDISYFYKQPSRWYTAANSQNLDLELTWAFVKALATETDVEMILIDTSIQTLLREYAEHIGDDPEWVRDLFQGTPKKRPPLIRHAKGHRTHIHIRFYNPTAQEGARRMQTLLAKHNKVKPRYYTVSYTAKKGDSLISIGKRFGVAVKDLKKANKLKGSTIYAKKTYAIPRVGTFGTPQVVIPPRRLPNAARQAFQRSPEARLNEASR